MDSKNIHVYTVLCTNQYQSNTSFYFIIIDACLPSL